ncbi:MAG: hypothetical protein ACTHLY_06755, partial [Pseudolabrys sp.]
MSSSVGALARAANLANLRAKGPAFFPSLARTGLRISAAALLIVLGSQSLQTAVANGDTRTLT